MPEPTQRSGTASEIISVVVAIEKLLPIGVGLAKSLHDLLAGSSTKTINEILDGADADWNDVLATARAEIAATPVAPPPPPPVPPVVP